MLYKNKTKYILFLLLFNINYDYKYSIAQSSTIKLKKIAKNFTKRFIFIKNYFNRKKQKVITCFKKQPKKACLWFSLL